nr:hypothetical protein [Candidatus Sigynarchaeota archaeon]
MRDERKDPDSIIRAIFTELGRGGSKTPTEIAKAINGNSETIRKYLELIEFVQDQQRLVLRSTEDDTVAMLVKDDN